MTSNVESDIKPQQIIKSQSKYWQPATVWESMVYTVANIFFW